MSYSYSTVPATPLKFGVDDSNSSALLSPINVHNPSMSPSISRSGSGFLPSHLFPVNSSNATPNPQVRKEEYSASGMLPTWDQTNSREQRYFPSSSPFTTKQQSPVENKKTEFNSSVTNSADRESLPPSESLYDSNPMSYYAENISEIPTSSSSVHSSIANNNEIQSISQFNEIESTGETTTDERWVTVFGFTPVSSSIVTKTFQKYGDIIRCEMGKGNFMHLLYRTRLQAQKALSKNGKKIDEGLIIGVVSRDSVEREINTKLPRRQVQTSTQESPLNTSQSASFASSNSKPLYVSSAQPIVSSSDSWWKKVQEYVLGW